MTQPREVTPRATWLLAPNPGPMTFDGTNSWVLHEPGRRGAVIVDPGPTTGTCRP
jgi:glyoxylase-like metal-dependent hydrolase (beta-lactamase superfamily II)